jgi:hypothetical protein
MIYRILIICVLAGASLLNAADQTVIFRYNLHSRLIEADYGTNGVLRYSYDLAGNLLSKSWRQEAPPDSDGDFIEDAWEIATFGNLDRDGKGDFDNDGFSDLSEFLAGTDPRNAQSLLRITGLTAEQSDTRIEWPQTTGKNYQVHYKDDLLEPSWKPVQATVQRNATLAWIIDPSRQSKRFYRVTIVN